MSDDLRELFARAKDVAATARSIARQGWSQKASRRFEAHGGSLCDPSRLVRFASGEPGENPERLDERDRWGLDALRGRLVELSARGATATLTAAIELVLEAQQAGEPVAWVTLGNATFYPPDVADSGVDLAALAVVRVHDVVAVARAAERLLRSGGFGLVVLDLAGSASDPIALSISSLGRLVTLAQTHDAAVVCLTEKPNEAPSLGSLVSLRAEALRLHAPEAADAPAPSSGRSYHVTLRALKDKRRGPGWTRTTKLRGPSGL